MVHAGDSHTPACLPEWLQPVADRASRLTTLAAE